MATSMLSSKSSNDSLQSKASMFSIPDELAPAVAGPMVWEATELNPTEYVVHLDTRDIQDIRAAVLKVKSKSILPSEGPGSQANTLRTPVAGTPRSSICQDTFDIGSPDLASRLSSISKEIHHGRGIAVLRGLDAANFNDEEAVIAFVGVCSYVCPERATDSYADQTLSHVRDATQDDVPRWARDIGLAGSKITVAMDFHSDRFSGDVLALHVRNDGGIGAGGDQFVVSFWKIYNELLENHLEVLETMSEANWPFELKQKGSAPYLEMGPTLLFSKGRPICQLVKAPLLGTPLIHRDLTMPSVTSRQLHALDVVERTARRFCTKLDRQHGDIQFLNNLSIMHARGAYRGTAGKPSTRHLLRMFLRDPANAWEKPAHFLHNFNDPFLPGRPQNLPVIDNDPWRIISGRESHG